MVDFERYDDLHRRMIEGLPRGYIRSRLELYVLWCFLNEHGSDDPGLDEYRAWLLAQGYPDRAVDIHIRTIENRLAEL